MAKNENKKSFGVNILDLFSGIGGFSLGLEQAGQKINWHGFSDIDKFANKLFKRRFPNATELGSIENISYKSLKGQKLDLLTGGFPCQSFSIAGKRQGFKDTRGTLFFEIERILRDYIENGKPIPCILLENVKGLLSHDNKRTFATVYKVLTDLNYTIECQVVNTRWFLPQNRERIFIFGRYNGNPSGRKVFPIRKNEEEIKENGQKISISNSSPREFGWRDVSPALCARDYKDPKLVKLGELQVTAKKRTYDTPAEINEYLRNHKNDTNKNIAKKLDIPKTQVEHYFRVDKSRAIPSPKIWLKLKEILNFDNKYDKQVTEIYEKEVEYESSRRVYSSNGIAKTLDTNDQGLYQVADFRNDEGLRIRKELISPCLSNRRHSEKDISTMPPIIINSRIRRLTPTECERLQGFPDGWTDGQSNTQRYKQLGNAVSVPVIKAIMERIFNGLQR